MEVLVILNKTRNLGLKYIFVLMKLMYEFKTELNFGLKFNCKALPFLYCQQCHRRVGSTGANDANALP